MAVTRACVAALALWMLGAVAGRRIMINLASLETLQSMWGTLSWVMPTKFLLLLAVALVASLLHGRQWDPFARRHLLAVLTVPVFVLLQDTVFLIASDGPNYLFWTMRELATVAGALTGWALGAVINRGVRERCAT
ncbi:hypothetical protein FHX37_0803 [Haloactinospora alba]|uniref:Uncharacterized protein n=1 Tax=Haloactinospora alba TaxID=405555 RepID=A0A543NGD4_9ACTN|nr:hypothetical protein [Haloactinospora alba]TQN30915.1 hypothetical protein FHX37_0803 [Haloactinospora alba]